MRDTIELAREVYGAHTEWAGAPLDRLEQLVAIVRADEREEFQRWFDAVTAQHKQLILAEREACAKVCEAMNKYMDDGEECAAAIRARGNT